MADCVQPTQPARFFSSTEAWERGLDGNVWNTINDETGLCDIGNTAFSVASAEDILRGKGP